MRIQEHGSKIKYLDLKKNGGPASMVTHPLNFSFIVWQYKINDLLCQERLLTKNPEILLPW